MSYVFRGNVVKKMIEPTRRQSKSDEILCLIDENEGIYWDINLDLWELRIVENENACWDWKGSYHRQGYGMFKVILHGTSTKSGMMNAQRVAMALELGRPLKRTERVSCTCGKLDCCNPDHLFVTDYEEQNEHHRRYDYNFYQQNINTLLKTQSNIARILGVTLNEAHAMKEGFRLYLLKHF